MYFILKDENVRIVVVMFVGYNCNIKFKLENGMKVFVKGKIFVYEVSGFY